jgi:hypothetical protein
MAQAPLIDQSLLEKLERLSLHWQKSFPGLVGGRNASRFSGAGQEFLDHRHFHTGDDYRAVNWRAYLRLEKLLLKLFQVEPRIPSVSCSIAASPWVRARNRSFITRGNSPRPSRTSAWSAWTRCVCRRLPIRLPDLATAAADGIDSCPQCNS